MANDESEGSPLESMRCRDAEEDESRSSLLVVAMMGVDLEVCSSGGVEEDVIGSWSYSAVDAMVDGIQEKEASMGSSEGSDPGAKRLIRDGVGPAVARWGNGDKVKKTEGEATRHKRYNCTRNSCHASERRTSVKDNARHRQRAVQSAQEGLRYASLGSERPP